MLFRDPLFGFPVQRLPVVNDDFALAELFFKARRQDVELFVIVAFAGRDKDAETVPHCQSRSDDQDIFRIACILWVCDLIQDLPCDEHRHNDSLAGTGSHLATKPLEIATIGGYLDTHLFRLRRFCQPYQGLDGLELAEEKFDFTPVFNKIDCLKELLEEFYKKPESIEMDKRKQNIFYDTILKIQRKLIRINYTSREEFNHDPAAMVPPIPDIASVLKLQYLNVEEQ
jgi:hypothetical protein